VTQQALDIHQLGTGLEQVGGKAVTK